MGGQTQEELLHAIWMIIIVGLILLGGPRLVGALLTAVALGALITVPVVGALFMGWGYSGAMWATAGFLILVGLLCKMVEIL
jgi:hypothetical protein